MKRYFILFTLFVWFSAISAQDVDTLRTWQEDFDAFSEVEDFDSENWQDLFETLDQLHQNPIDINEATMEDLQQIPFLTDKQIEDIQFYIYRYGKMKSLNELIMIESLGYEARHLLLNFVTINEKTPVSSINLEKLLKYGKHEVAFTARVPLYNRKGDEEGYLGYKLKHSFRYDYNYNNKLRFGLVGSNSSGEPFFGRNSWGYDHYNYYFMLKNIGRLKTFALGTYKVSFGMGLVVANGYSFGKMASLTSLGRTSNNIRPHASQSESNYFNGVATTVEVVKGLKLSAFLSNRNLDATVKKHSSDISAFVTSGYHRTETEWDKKGNTNEKTIGGNIAYKYKHFNLGLTAIYSHLDRKLSPDTVAIYRKYYPQGTDFFNIGANYGANFSKWSFAGEVAMNRDNAVATINRLTYSPSYKLKVMALQRFYSYKYNSLYANSFSEGGSIQNESGVYLGAEWMAADHWTLLAYTDWFYFPWAKYQISESSYGCDNLVQATYSTNSLRFIGRYRMKIREKDLKQADALANNTQHKLKLSLDYLLGNPLTLKTQIDGSLVTFDEQEQGYMITQSMNYNNMKHLKLNLSAGYFNASDYDARLYAYEKNVNYMFAFPSYYGEGIHLALYIQYYIKDKLQLSARAAHTKYFDRSTIGSSYQLIDKSYQTDLDFQVIWKF